LLANDDDLKASDFVKRFDGSAPLLSCVLEVHVMRKLNFEQHTATRPVRDIGGPPGSALLLVAIVMLALLTYLRAHVPLA
jgi:hypothetical protein